ncbi:MAG: lysozyme, partial [Caulobacteraceae bacterium]
MKRFETFEPNARPAAHGGWTIGYGHTRTAREGAVVSREDAEALLLYDLSAAADLVDATVRTPLNASQFEALTAFAFGVGPEHVRRSGALAQVNAGAYDKAADEIGRWRAVGRDA